MACFLCNNVEHKGPTQEQQYVDVFGYAPLPKSYVCPHCHQNWVKVSRGHWRITDDRPVSSKEEDAYLTEMVLGAHGCSGQKTRIEMIIGDQRFSVLGTAETIIAFDGTEEIELLRHDATPDCEVLAEDAPAKFQGAVLLLALQKRPFRTVLRHGWTSAAVLWSEAAII